MGGGGGGGCGGDCWRLRGVRLGSEWVATLAYFYFLMCQIIFDSLESGYHMRIYVWYDMMCYMFYSTKYSDMMHLNSIGDKRFGLMKSMLKTLLSWRTYVYGFPWHALQRTVVLQKKSCSRICRDNICYTRSRLSVFFRRKETDKSMIFLPSFLLMRHDCDLCDGGGFKRCS